MKPGEAILLAALVLLLAPFALALATVLGLTSLLLFALQSHDRPTERSGP